MQKQGNVYYLRFQTFVYFMKNAFTNVYYLFLVFQPSGGSILVTLRCRCSSDIARNENGNCNCNVSL